MTHWALCGPAPANLLLYMLQLTLCAWVTLAFHCIRCAVLTLIKVSLPRQFCSFTCLFQAGLLWPCCWSLVISICSMKCLSFLTLSLGTNKNKFFTWWFWCYLFSYRLYKKLLKGRPIFLIYVFYTIVSLALSTGWHSLNVHCVFKPINDHLNSTLHLTLCVNFYHYSVVCKVLYSFLNAFINWKQLELAELRPFSCRKELLALRYWERWKLKKLCR